jgi:uncharacterized RDD family membrane protein YckC
MPSEQQDCPRCGAQSVSDAESCPNCKAEPHSETDTATPADVSTEVYGSGYCPICQTKTRWKNGICCECENDESKSVARNLQGLQGDSTKRRIFAAWIDNAGALVAAAVIAMQLTFLSPLVQGLSAYALFLLYFFVSEAIFSSTVGKWCFGLSVQSIDGTKCTITQAAIRTVLRIFELNPILLGALPAIVLILFSRRKQRLGGMLSKTVVTSSR